MVFIDAIPMLFFSCYVLCQNPLPSGTWLLQWHLMLASMDIVFKGLPNIPGRSPLTSPSSLPPVCHAVTFSQRHTVTLFSGSHAGVRCVGVRIAPTPRYIWIKSLPNLNLSERWWSHFAHICARACDRLIFFWFQLEQESVSVNTFTCQPCVFILCPAYSGSPCGLSVLSPPESAESRSSPHVP